MPDLWDEDVQNRKELGARIKKEAKVIKHLKEGK